MSTLREYKLTIKAQVATYQSDAEVQELCANLAEYLQTYCNVNEHFIFQHPAVVEVTYATK